MTYTNVTGRSGHESGTNTYEDKRNVAKGLRGGKVLSRWSTEAVIRVPTLNSLPIELVYNKLYRMMDNFLFVISPSMSAFLQNQPLHMTLRTCMASLIMYHPDVTNDFGPSNAISTKKNERVSNECRHL